MNSKSLNPFLRLQPDQPQVCRDMVDEPCLSFGHYGQLPDSRFGHRLLHPHEQWLSWNLACNSLVAKCSQN